jgi:hypothetical protein
MRIVQKDFPKLSETLQSNSTLMDRPTLKFGLSINFPEFPKFFHEEQLMNSGHDGPSELPGRIVRRACRDANKADSQGQHKLALTGSPKPLD